jgi:sugar (pentulose or hexulose) kinase
LMVALGMGVYPDVESLDALVKIDRVVEPRAELAERYDALYDEYRELYLGLAPIYRRLSDVP